MNIGKSEVYKRDLYVKNLFRLCPTMKIEDAKTRVKGKFGVGMDGGRIGRLRDEALKGGNRKLMSGNRVLEKTPSRNQKPVKRTIPTEEEEVDLSSAVDDVVREHIRPLMVCNGISSLNVKVIGDYVTAEWKYYALQSDHLTLK